MTPCLTFAGLLTAIARRKSRQTAALYAQLVATRGAGTPSFVVDIADLTEELTTHSPHAGLFTREGPHWGANWCVATGLWEHAFVTVGRRQRCIGEPARRHWARS